MPGRLRRWATGRNVLVALGVFLAALIAMNVAATLFFRATGGYGLLDLGGGANLFDDRGAYDAPRAYLLITHYGAVGIHRYYALLVADTIFPPVFGAFATLAIAWGIGRLRPGARWLYLLALIAPAYTVADWSENIGIVTMLMHYPERLSQVAIWTNAMRGVKVGLANLSVLLALGLALAVAWRSRRSA